MSAPAVALRTSRGTAGGDRLERHGSRITETASSATDCTRDSARTRPQIGIARLSEAAQAGGTRCGFPCRERLTATRQRCRQPRRTPPAVPREKSAERRSRQSLETCGAHTGARGMPAAIRSFACSLRLSTCRSRLTPLKRLAARLSVKNRTRRAAPVSPVTRSAHLPPEFARFRANGARPARRCARRTPRRSQPALPREKSAARGSESGVEC
jgi:hypothetical protein